MSVVLMIVVAVLVLGAVIFVHELGHFIAAKKSGIKVNEFAMGMGPKLFSIKRGETAYSLRLFPIGGFVSMEGEDEESSDERGFQQASIPKRLLVTVAGAVMNFVLGFLALVVLTATGGDIASRTISVVRNPETGLQPGDTILKVNGRACYVIDDMFYEFARTQNGTFDLVVRRDGQNVELKNVEFPVAKAVDQETGEPVIDETTGEQYEYLDVGFYVEPVKPNVLSVTKQSFLNTMSYTKVIYLSLFDLIRGRVAINQLSGPVGIVSEIGRAVAIGWRPVVQLLALISISLGVVNLLPLPALDGGRALLLGVEAIRRKPLKQKYEIAINLVGFALLIGLMIFVSVFDIQRLVT